MLLPTTPQSPSSVQPGGGVCVAIELAWGRLRRAYLRTLRPGYVRRMLEKRQGRCDQFTNDVIDPRDLKFISNVCGYSFRPEDDAFAWRGRLGFARHGLAEMILFSLVVILGLGLTAASTLWVHPVCAVLAVPLLLFWAEIIYFFRDPERPIPPDADGLISPADGVITNIEEVDEPDFGPALRISIFLSIFNVHVNRVPRSGTITNVRYFPGAYLDARNPDSAKRNEQLWIDMTDAATGRALRVKQISGAIARRIVCWLKPGDIVTKGHRLGMIKLGSRTDILLPPGSFQVALKVGDKVQGGLTILARAI